MEGGQQILVDHCMCLSSCLWGLTFHLEISTVQSDCGAVKKTGVQKQE